MTDAQRQTAYHESVWKPAQRRVVDYWKSMWEKSMHNPSNKAKDASPILGDLPDTAPENPRNTPPPRTAWSKDPWPDVRGTTTRPDSTFSDKDLSILTEAHGLVHGDRQASYGHPAVDFGRTAGLANILLASKLKSDLGPEDIATLMVCVKLSRECHEHKRDNLVDACGYLECRERVLRFLGTASRTPKDAL